ncbi:MAG: VWA domain-containing protein [Nanoarchaeota archaeon]
MKRTEKKGFLFTIDSVLGVSLLLLGTIIYSLFFITSDETTQSSLISQDAVDFLSTLKVGDLDPELLANLTGLSDSVDPDLSVLEQIAYFWVKNETDAATNLTDYIFDMLIPNQFGYSIVVGGDVVYENVDPDQKTLTSSRRMVSGIEKLKPLKGFLSYAYFSGINNTMLNSYVYFGGFSGQGNITVALELPDYLQVLNITLEGAFSDNFTLLINGTEAGYFIKQNEDPLRADVFYVDSAIYGYLSPGEINYFNIRFNITEVGRNGFIGGGFINVLTSVSVNSSSVTNPFGYLQFTDRVGDYVISKRYFPQLHGFINLFGSEYFPPHLINISAHLHYFADWGELDNSSLDLIVGNTTVWSDNNLTGDEEHDITVVNFSEALNLYEGLPGKTVPIRFGLSGLNLTYGSKDIAIMTDISGSMSLNFGAGGGTYDRECDDVDLYDVTTKKLSVAKCLDLLMSHLILDNRTDSRVALTSFDSSVQSSLSLTDNITALEDEISSYETYGGNTCIACGIYESMLQVLNPHKIIPAGSNWSYYDDSPAGFPGIGWNLINYNSDFWPFGPTPIGFFDEVNTPLTPKVTFLRNESAEIENFSVHAGNTLGLWSIAYIRRPGDGRLITFQNTTGDLTSEVEFGDSNVMGTIDGYPGATVMQRYPETYRVPEGCEEILEFRTHFGFIGIPKAKGNISIYRFIGPPEDETFERVLEFKITPWLTGNGLALYDLRFSPLTGIRGGDFLAFYTPETIKSLRSGTQDELILFEDGNSDLIMTPSFEDELLLAIGATCKRHDHSKLVIDFESQPFNPAETYNELHANILGKGSLDFNYSISFFNWENNSWTEACYHETSAGSWTPMNCHIENSVDAFFRSSDARVLTRLEVRNIDPSQLIDIDDVNITATVNSGNIFFRKNFSIDPLILNDSQLKIMSNDIAEVYLNDQWSPILVDDEPREGTHWDSRVVIDNSLFVDGENSLAIKLRNDDFEMAKFDAELVTGDIPEEHKFRSIIIMSDGRANRCYPEGPGCAALGYEPVFLDFPCTGPNADDECRASNQTVEFACRAHDLYGINIYAVAFNVNDELGIQTLNQSACCDDCNNFYSGSTPEELLEIYEDIGEEIANLQFVTQEAITSGLLESILYNDSYFVFNSTYVQGEIPYGMFPVTLQSPRFGNNETSYNFTLYENTTLRDARITSYSADKWTHEVKINNSNGNVTIFSMEHFNLDYEFIGDPFIVEIPVENFIVGNNTINISTAFGPSNVSGGSPDDRLFYTIFLPATASSEGIGNYAEECNWTIETEEEVNVTMTPEGVNCSCIYTSEIHTLEDGSYNGDNSIGTAMFNLLRQLDADVDGRIDVDIQQQNLRVVSTTTENIPYLWGPTLVEVRVWQ